MSKVDAQRAMRDARFAAYEARRASEGAPVTPAPAAAPRKAEVRPPKSDPSTTSPAAEPEPEPEGVEAACGHRSIGNKSCTRPVGHPEKSHRYS